MKADFLVVKTTNLDSDFLRLVTALDQDLWNKYPELKANYWGNNKIEFNSNAIVIYQNDQAVACGCFKKYDAQTVEIKRMYVDPIARGKGLAKRILFELEKEAIHQHFSVSILETLCNQTEAIGLYQNVGYSIINNYGAYAALENSVCMKKNLV